MNIQKSLFIVISALLCLSTVFSVVSCTPSPEDTAKTTAATETPPHESTAEITGKVTESAITDFATTEAVMDNLVTAQKDLYIRYGDDRPHEAISADLKELGCRFSVLPGCYLTGLYFEALPTWSTKDYSCFTVRLYAWNTDYQTSVSYEPLISAEYTGWTDNLPCDVNFLEISYDGFIGYPAGEYLWVFVGNTDMIGIWSMAPSEDCIYFNDGTECENGYRVIANMLIPET